MQYRTNYMLITDQYFLFLAKTSTMTLALIAIILSIAHTKGRESLQPEISILNKKRLKEYQNTCQQLKQFSHFNHKRKSLKKNEKKLKTFTEHLFIIDFKGDIHASGVTALRREIDLILELAQENDKVLLRIESRGGTVIGYGLVASQVHRLRQANLHLTIAIDQIAASGGYLVASLANEIIAAPFACIGSIGVAYEIPNIHNLLNSYGIEYKQVTAGQYKRTLSVFGKNTKDGEAKVQSDVEMTHELFKNYISQYRDLDIETVATGETWPAMVAHEKGLVDRLISSDEFIQAHLEDKLILQLKTPTKNSLTNLMKQKAVSLLQYME